MSVEALSVLVEREDVLGVLGYPPGFAPAPGVERLLEPLLSEARALVAPRGAWLRLAPERAAEVGLEPRRADALVIGLVTVGGALEAAAAARLACGEATASLVLEACGSAAVEEAADRLGVSIVLRVDSDRWLLCGLDDFYRRPPRIGCRVSPGYARWPLTAQRVLLARLPHRELDVRLERSCLMVPRKSISFAMWLGADAEPAAGLSSCPRCALADCPFRRAPREAR